MSRLSGLREGVFDVAIIGGGIIGCGIARDAAARGLRVALVEKHDFGSGTTAASTRIVHGGLRYLEMLDFRLVRLDLRERETLLRIAPHLVKPLEFLIPFFPGDRTSALKMRAGLAVYDALSFDKSLPSRRWLSAAGAKAGERALADLAVTGAAAYHDARVDLPERLALENVLAAERHGAEARNYCEATALAGAGTHTTLRLRDTAGGDETELRARVVVNATGAWLELAAAALTGRGPGVIRTTKGIHLVCPEMTDGAMVLFSAVDRRLMFAIPRAGLTWIGTTDTDYDGDPANARAGRVDIDYLLASVRHVFPALNAADVLHTTAGVRALVKRGGSESSVSRMHKVVSGPPVGPPGVVSVLGGKITGYRAIAEEVTDVLCRTLKHQRRGTTAEEPLPGAHASGPATAPPPLNLYGARAAEVMQIAAESPELLEPLSPRHGEIGAQAAHAARHERCVHLSDFLRRRTLLGASADQGLSAAAQAARIMARELGWSAEREAEEVAAYRQDAEARRGAAVYEAP